MEVGEPHGLAEVGTLAGDLEVKLFVFKCMLDIYNLLTREGKADVG